MFDDLVIALLVIKVFKTLNKNWYFLKNYVKSQKISFLFLNYLKILLKFLHLFYTYYIYILYIYLILYMFLLVI